MRADTDYISQALKIKHISLDALETQNDPNGTFGSATFGHGPE